LVFGASFLASSLGQWRRWASAASADTGVDPGVDLLFHPTYGALAQLHSDWMKAALLEAPGLCV
jgi:hypothetical protein